MFSELIVWYLFLGGISGGAFLVRFAVQMRAARALRVLTGGPCYPAVQEKELSWVQLDEFVARPLLAACIAAASLGCVCLMGDLARPEQAHVLFLRPVFSVIGVGAFSLVLFLLVSTLLLVVEVRQIKLPVVVYGALSLVAGALALVIIVYTGVYLHSIWTIGPWASFFLVPLFFFSSLATGVVLPYLFVGLSNLKLSAFSGPLKWLSRVDLVCVAGEVLSLCALFFHLNGLSIDSSFWLFCQMASRFLFW